MSGQSVKDYWSSQTFKVAIFMFWMFHEMIATLFQIIKGPFTLSVSVCVCICVVANANAKMGVVPNFQ